MRASAGGGGVCFVSVEGDRFPKPQATAEARIGATLGVGQEGPPATLILDLVLVSRVDSLPERPASCSMLSPALLSAKLIVKALISVHRACPPTQALTWASPSLPTPLAHQSHPAEKQTELETG